MDTPAVNVIVVAVPKAIAVPVLVVAVGCVTGAVEALAPEKVIWCAPV